MTLLWQSFFKATTVIVITNNPSQS